jgi:hypothetical protein
MDEERWNWLAVNPKSLAQLSCAFSALPANHNVIRKQCNHNQYHITPVSERFVFIIATHNNIVIYLYILPEKIFLQQDKKKKGLESEILYNLLR